MREEPSSDPLVSAPQYISHPFLLVYEWAWDRLRNHPPPVSERPDGWREDFIQEITDGVFHVTWVVRPPGETWRAIFDLAGIKLRGDDVELAYTTVQEHPTLDAYGREFLAEAGRLWAGRPRPVAGTGRGRGRSRDATKAMIRQALNVGSTFDEIVRDHGYSLSYVRELAAEINREERV
jgi:hypothetical protein